MARARGRDPGAAPSDSRAVDAYLARLPPDQREALERVRRIVLSVEPDAREFLSYRIPTYRYGRAMVHFAAFERHLSFYPGHLGRFPELARELKPFVGSTGTLRFTPERPIPSDLVRRLVRARFAQQESGRRSRRARAARRVPRARAPTARRGPMPSASKRRSSA